MRRAAGGDAGFSLVESLASLLVVAMIGLMLIEGVGTGRRVWEHQDTREAAGEAVEAAQIILRDRIEETFPETRYDSSPPVIAFSGKADRLEFESNPGDAGRPAPLRRYTLLVNTAGQLVLSSVSSVGPAGNAVAANQVLLTGVRQMEVSYFGPAAPDRQARWRREWIQQPLLPAIVRVRLAFEPGDPRPWPDLLISPRATIDSGCLLNPVTHGCKGRA